MRESRVPVKARRAAALLLALLILCSATGFVAFDEDVAAIARGIETFSIVYREAVTRYAEPVDAVQLLKAGLRGMLSALDPYTVYIDAKERADVDMLTQGSYGGVGASIATRGTRYIVSATMDDIPSGEGLRVGDEILRIDTTHVAGVLGLDMRQLLRGPSGSPIEIEILRPGIRKPLTLSLVRREVRVRSLAIAEQIAPGVAYCKLDRFTRSAGEELRVALRSMMDSSSGLVYVILDLRDNPGGLLEAAVDVTGLFVQRGSLVVSTRGRNSAAPAHEYRAPANPLLPSVRLVILVNRASASASEIVAGAIQDLDRGVIIGERTFGKGLVQTVIPLGPEASLKMTTSKYYTPAGRCIQRMEYGGTGRDRVLLTPRNDSIRHFRTLVTKRLVHDGGGIEPDAIAKADSLPPYVVRLHMLGAITQFAASIRNTARNERYPDLDQSQAVPFHAFLDSLRVDTVGEVEQQYAKLLAYADRDGLPASSMQKIRSLKQVFREHSRRECEKHWSTIVQELRSELAFQLGGKRQRFLSMWKKDTAVQRALSILSDQSAYRALLSVDH